MNKIQYKITKTITKERIKAITDLESENKLTAVELVKRAKVIIHPWHDEIYKQNDNQAAYLYRLQRAREIINKIKIIINNTEIYAFENVSIIVNETENEKQYVGIQQILNNEDYRNQVLMSALKELKTWKTKYSMYKELEKVFEVVDEMENSLFN